MRRRSASRTGAKRGPPSPPWCCTARSRCARARDRYDRVLARVGLDGQDLGGWMVEHGHAWSDGWRGSGGPYARQQAQAAGTPLGLWRSAGALEPRTFRKGHGSCHR